MSRSYLFIPGNTPSMLQNMDIFDADSVIIDFEDSVIDYDKDAARLLLQQYIQTAQPQGIGVYVRINDVNSPFYKEDITITHSLNITGYVLPKATLETVSQFAKDTTKPFIPIIESPLGVLQAESIAAVPQVIGLLFGAEDFTKEMGIERSKEGTEIFHARNHISIVCHAYDKEAIDTPWIHKEDEAGLQEDTTLASRLGFTGKASIHPNHVPVINTVFTPSPQAILDAKRIVKKAEETGKGAFSLDGKMVDIPIIEKAKKLLLKAQKYNVL